MRLGFKVLVGAYSCAGSGGSFVNVLRLVYVRVFRRCGVIANNSLNTGGFASDFVYVTKCEMSHCRLVVLKVRPVTKEA